MPHVKTWDEFVTRAEAMFRASPSKTRYCVKYRHCDGKLVLKVTDDKECLLFKTDQQQDARRMEKLNNLFFILMTKGGEASVDDVEKPTPEVAAPAAQGQRHSNRRQRRKG
mmetsp:Transcript_7344/g.17651  ORF Transcript_7344/g.17651 Transcript_7344/m.17651 type:complete len:111 (-) Transcript_7344:90-422(-)